jgi:hypothetical protein
MDSPMSGGCACGSVRYEVEGEPVFAAHCHCRECQRASGGPMMTAVVFPEAAFRLVRGTPRTYTYRGDSGQPVERAFCAACSAPLYLRPALAPGMLFVQAPSLDEPGWIKPSFHVYVSSAQSWDPTGDDLPRFDKLPPRGTSADAAAP